MNLSRLPTICICVLTCFFFARQSSREYSTASAYGLPASKRSRLIQAARKGDAAAAERLSGYYTFIADDIPTAIYWLRVAERNGSERHDELIRRLQEGYRESLK